MRTTHKMHRKPKTKPKPAGPSSPARTANMWVGAYDCVQLWSTATQPNSSDNLSTYPSDNHHSSHGVQWRGNVSKIKE